MENSNFKEILKEAIKGDKIAIQELINIYEPLINKYSIDYEKNIIDEDCKSKIIEKIQIEIRKFKINEEILN